MDDDRQSADAGKANIGTILLDEKLVTSEQLEEALSVQETTGRRLGNILVDMGFVDEEDFCRLLSEQLGLPFFDLSFYLIDPAVVALVPEHLCERYRLIALKKQGRKLTVAMMDPLNDMALEDLRILTGLEIKVVVATPSKIYHALAEAYEAIKVSRKLASEFPESPLDGPLFSGVGDPDES